MESTLTGVVESVTGRATRTGPIYDVVIGGQKVSTFKQPIAEEANALQGSTVEARVSVEQKGDYTNYTLLGVKLVDAAPTTANGIPLAPATSPIPVNSNQYQRERTPKESAQIIRQSSAASAFAYASRAGLSTDEAFNLATEIENYALHGSRYGAQGSNVAAVGAETNDSIPW